MATIKTIESRHNPWIQHLRKLQEDGAYRREKKKLLLEGSKLISERYTSAGALLVENPEKLPLPLRHEPYTLISSSVSRYLADTQHAEGIFLEIDLPLERLPEKITRALICEGLADPGNLGTLGRTALAFGWEALLLLPGCCDLFNPKALRASKGAFLELPYKQIHWADLKKLQKEQGWTLYAADMQGTPVKETPPKALALVVGNEGQGISAESRAHCQLICLPMQGSMESLNVGVAAGIFMYMLRSHE